VLVESELATLQQAAADGGGVLIVDEAYGEYAGPAFVSAVPAAATGSNVCVLKTLSKAYGLAGMRVGYTVGDPDVIARTDRLLAAIPYHVNRLAQCTAVAALADQRFMRETVEMTVKTRERFRRGLLRLGLSCSESHTNFVLLELGADSSAIAAALRERNIQVRDTAGMGLPGHIRVSIGTDDEMDTALNALTDLLAGQQLLTPAQDRADHHRSGK
jgi:histidinol-phosphate aminotransferase